MYQGVAGFKSLPTSLLFKQVLYCPYQHNRLLQTLKSLLLIGSHYWFFPSLPVMIVYLSLPGPPFACLSWFLHFKVMANVRLRIGVAP